MPIPEGTRVGNFTVERILGKGSMGTVYRAWSVHGNLLVALKTLSSKYMDDKTVLTLFQEEAQAGLEVDHPHIVKTLYVGAYEGQPYIVFEFVNGVPLADLIRSAPIPEGACVWVLRQMGQALRHLREKGIVHQDIKPENILIDAQGNCKLTDLGFARIPASEVEWSQLSAGTSWYMAPEQWLVGEGVKIDCRTDIYALGATIYHAAVGQPPFVSKDEYEVYRMHRDEKPVAANVRNSKLSMELAKILQKMLEKRHGDRYKTPEDLLLATREIRTKAIAPVVSFSRISAHGGGVS